MATQHVYDMLSVDRTQLGNDAGTSGGSTRKTPKSAKNKKIPKGMSRELYSIMAVDGDLPEVYSTIPSTPPVSDSWKKTVQRDKKRRARKWLMTNFSASSRPNAQKFLAHWCKAEDADKDYPFAKLAPHGFSEPTELPGFSSSEFGMLPVSDPSNPWSEEATRHLMDLVARFDMRFEIIQAFWNEPQYGKKDCVDLRARFTEVFNFLVKWRNDNRPLLPPYDAATERKRRIQLDRLQTRSQEEIDEHAMLKEQERKIRSNKEERERRQGAIQMRLSGFKARTQADSPKPSPSRISGQKNDKPAVPMKKNEKKKSAGTAKKSDKRKMADVGLSPALAPLPETTLKFPEIKGAGAWNRSSRLKFPNSVSAKKTTAVKTMLVELSLDENPLASEEAIEEFNQLRSDLLFLYELKSAVVSAQADLAHLKVEIGEKAQDLQVQAVLEKAETALKACVGPNLISSVVDVPPTTSGTRYRRKTTVDQLKTQKSSAGSGTE